MHNELKVKNKLKASAIAVQRYGINGDFQKETGKSVKKLVKYDVLILICPVLMAFCPYGENQNLIVVL